MNCNNCGARVKDNAKICPVCGALLDDEANYTLLATDERYDDIYSAAEKKSRGWLKTLIVTLLVIAVAGGGAYYYFWHNRPKERVAPIVTFTEGSGIINRNEKVIFVGVDNSDIEYIHGVNLYEGDITSKAEDSEAQKPEPITSDYEYTKNLDSTFRAIFFDTEELKLNKNKEYTYTFEMYFSFVGSDEIYPYTKVVTFSGNIKDDASDSVFDHSLTEDTAKEESSTEPTTEESTTEKKTGSADFIYDGYWYTSPYTDGDNRSISAFKFGTDKTYKITHYDKKGEEDWVIYSEEGRFDIDGDTLLLDDGTQLIFDSEKEEIFEESDGKKTNSFTKRKYNSSLNAEDFFGI